MAARYGSLINKWTAVAVAVAVMAALLAAALPAWAQDAPPSIPDAQTIFDYAEDRTGAITTYSARDPENKPVFWTLGGPDAADFTIADGILLFKSQPNFEVPTDRANDEDGDSLTSTPDPPATADPCSGEGACNNVYKVTVRFGAGGEDGTPGEPTDKPIPDEYDGDDLGEVELTITVTNVDEPGMVVISPRQPQEGTELTAILTDEDNIAPGTGEWQWARADSMTGTFTPIPERSRDRTYRPTEADLRKYLQVTVEYVDRAGPVPRTVKAMSAYRVRKDTNTSNQDPKFPDQSTLIGVNGPTEAAPTQGREVTDRFIPETATAGTRVGAPVTAFDDKTDIEVITYLLRDGNAQVNENDDGNSDTPIENDGHAASFDIDTETGQITVSVRAMLDVDGTDGAGAGATNPYNVVVRAVDGDGDTQDIDVAIHLLKRGEPPMIDRVYDADRLPTVTPPYSARDRAPTEMSHKEVDRANSTATEIDTDLETGAGAIEAAVYTATDPETPASNLKWMLEGVDEKWLRIVDTTPSGTTSHTEATLSFRSGPDFEKPRDDNDDNVYEVTIVVTDGTYGMDGKLRSDKLPVTVKVIDSTDDNKPGNVKFSNRVPEVATALTATLEDDNEPIPVGEVKWQWYRATASNTANIVTYPTRCPTPSDGARYFIDTAAATIAGDWEKIPEATSDTYTPGYDEDSGGMSASHANITGAVRWTGGDIDVTISTDSTTGDKTYSEWENAKCLRAAVTYRDTIGGELGKDRTHSEPDDPATTDVDETREGAFRQTEYPVKPIDEENDAPEFLDPAGDPVSLYRADDIEDIEENTYTAGDLLIKDAPDAVNLAATDPMTDEDDSTDDILTYTLSGQDKTYFRITGTVDNPGATSPSDDGVLRIKAGLDYEVKREYQVIITATDPSGEHDSVTVNVNITNMNEGPNWAMPEEAVRGEEVRRRYSENRTADVETFKASDPETSGIIYSLVTADDGTSMIEADAVADHALFEISSTRGTLRFKASPNYEDPEDVGANNMYQVTVKAEVADDENPRHFITQKVTVVVTNVNERPVFFETTDKLDIAENPDDPEKEATPKRTELYLLNRGVGKPAANLPANPNLDVGIPIVAVDDDNTAGESTRMFPSYDYTGPGTDRTSRPIQLIDGLTYELSGADAKPFHIVPATGQVLTLEKLDYEAKQTYKVTVTATDPDGASDSIMVTIMVTDVDEAPVGGLLTLAGETSHTHAETDRDDLGRYTVSGATTTDVTWDLEGADASYFMLDDSTGRSRMLSFKSAPNYEMPRGQAMSDTNTNTYMVTVKASAGDEVKMVEVTVMVTNVEEPGMVTLSSGGAKLGTLLRATLSDEDIVVGATEWQWHRVDPATGSSNPITGAREDSYTPVAADVGNHLMVTATYTDREGAGKSASASITIPVADANARPEFAAATATHEVAENMPPGTLVGSPITATDPNGDNLTYRVSGADYASFTVDDDGQLETSVSFDYEAKSSYSVTIMATDPEGLSGSIAVTVNVTNVDERGMVSLSPSQPSVGTPITASVTDPDSAPTGKTYRWSHSTAMNGTFTPYAAETTPRFTPRAADVDRYLRVTVNYNDVHGAQTESGTTEMAVIMNVAPAFSSETATRSVAENTAAGMNIGAPVMATDDDNDTLRYMLSGTDAASFDIGMSTGQLMTKAALDYETKMSYMVTVMATDPDGASDSIMVTIMVTDVDEGDPVDPVVARYDTNGDGEIQKSEVIAAINDYLFPQAGVDPISKAEVIRLINLYLFG